MSIRDIKDLLELIDNRIKLGLDLDNSICKDFQNLTKSHNYIFSEGIDLIYKFFTFESMIKSNFLNSTIKHIGKNKLFNNLLRKLADNGLRI